MAIYIELARFGNFATNPHLPRGFDISGAGIESDTSMAESSSALILDIAGGRLVIK